MAIEAQSHPISYSPIETMAGVYRRNGSILSGLAALIGAGSIATNLGDAAGGDIPAVCRAALGAVGLAVAVLLQLRPAIGWRLGWFWALAQIPFFAWSLGGSPTALWPTLPLIMSNKVSINGVLASYTAFGINFTGVILLIVFNRLRVAADWRER